MRQVKYFYGFLITFLFISFGCATKQVSTFPSQKQGENGQKLELPSVNLGERVIQHAGFSLVFNDEKRIAKWIAYSLTPSKSKSKLVERKNDFHPDPSIESSPTPNDYNHSGYDRGHLVPAEDMRWSAESLHDSFLMTNMAPQKAHLNRGIWKQLESKVRKWSLEYEHLYIAAGPILTEECLQKLVKSICVPKRFFKVVLAIKGSDMKTAGFIIPQNYKSNTLNYYSHTVREVESITGIDFFAALPIQTAYNVETVSELREISGNRNLATKKENTKRSTATNYLHKQKKITRK